MVALRLMSISNSAGLAAAELRSRTPGNQLFPELRGNDKILSPPNEKD